MFTVVITEKGGKPVTRTFDKPEITIGRIQGNDIILPKSNISKRHARIINNGGSFVVIDAKSTNGTYINGKRIDAPYDLRAGDKVFVGDFTVELEAEGSAAAPPAPPSPQRAKDERSTSRPGKGAKKDVLADEDWGEDADENAWGDEWDGQSAKQQPSSATALDSEALARPGRTRPEARPVAAPAPRPEARPKAQATPQPKAKSGSQPARPPAPPAAAREPSIARRGHAREEAEPLTDDASQALRDVHERLLRSLDLRRVSVEKMGDDELRARTRASVEEIVESMHASGELPSSVEPRQLIDSVLDEALGLGPLEDLLQDESVTEILVNGPRKIYVERGGRIEATDRSFSSDQAVLGVIERIVAPLGRRIDESSPMVDARLKDGSRVNAIIPPLALNGPTITVRKFTREPLLIDDLVAYGGLTAAMAEFLETCVKARKNIVISGGTGSGKTTMLNVLSSFIPSHERILTIEDAAELKLEQEHVVSLESRPANIEGRGAITIRDLVRNALRMRPDRIVVGECRGGEALDMLQAMNTGHEGSLTTVHANSPRDALSRLETMVLMSGMELPVRAIRDQIASAVDVIVQTSRAADGSRRVTHISEVTGMELDVITMQDIFVFEQRGFDAEGRVLGSFRSTGFIPRFYEELKAMGIAADLGIFQEE